MLKDQFIRDAEQWDYGGTIMRHSEHADFIEVATPILRRVFPYSRQTAI
jgi:hypothetical protein